MKDKFYSLEEKFTFDDVLIVPVHSEVPSRSEEIIDTSVTIGTHKFKVPVISSNMDTITDIKMAHKMAQLGGLGLIHRYMSVKETQDKIDAWEWGGGTGGFPTGNPLGLSVGSIDNKLERERLDLILRNPKRSYDDSQIILCADLAHGDSLHMIKTIKAIRKEYGFKGLLIAGNTATYEGTARLLEAGADLIRVGVGPGSACTTRKKTGVGFPQLSCVYECAKAGPVIADGGIRGPDDSNKAIAAGALFVMIGGMLAGTDCTPHWDEAHAHHLKSLAFGGNAELPEVTYRGMASKEAREAFSGIGKNAEGMAFKVKIRPEGSTEEVIKYLAEGLRSGMSYVNATTMKAYEQNAKFIRITSTTVQENVPHFSFTGKK